MNYLRPTIIALLALAGIVALASPAQSSPGVTTRVSVDSSGAEGDKNSENPAISADGRFVAFDSFASNLVAGDTNDRRDIFVRDRWTGNTQRVSVDSAGNEGNDSSHSPTISADGQYVAFRSRASNLVPGDTNDRGDIFVRDRWTGNTKRVSVDSSGVQSDSHSYSPAISADGRYVAFRSRASNLVLGDTNGANDIFVHDRQTGVTTRVSVDSSGNEGIDDALQPAMNADGRYVAFCSRASNLVVGDTNGANDIFVHDRQTGVTTRVSVDSSGAEGGKNSENPAISADGRYVAFHSGASNLVPGDTNDATDVFVHDRQTVLTTRISVDSSGKQGNSGSFGPAISAHGRYLAFYSVASNLVPDDTNSCQGFVSCSDAFVHDRQTGATARVSVDSWGSQGNYHSVVQSDVPAISGDGRYVAFVSSATNLVAGDTNDAADVFVHDRGGPPPGPVGGVVDIATGGSAPSSARPESSARDYTAPIAAAVAAGVVALAGGWYARRRWT